MQQKRPVEAAIVRDTRRRITKLFTTRVVRHAPVLTVGMTCNEHGISPQEQFSRGLWRVGHLLGLWITLCLLNDVENVSALCYCGTIPDVDPRPSPSDYLSD